MLRKHVPVEEALPWASATWISSLFCLPGTVTLACQTSGQRYDLSSAPPPRLCVEL